MRYYLRQIPELVQLRVSLVRLCIDDNLGWTDRLSEYNHRPISELVQQRISLVRLYIDTILGYTCICRWETGRL